MRINPITWFAKNWSGTHTRVLGDYQAIGREHPYFLADIALQGFVYVPMPHPRDIFEAGTFEGRRSLAVDIINMTKAPHDELRALIARSQNGGTK